MPRRAKGLSAATVQKAKPGRYCDGDGLWLTVREGPDNKFWSHRYHQDGKLREAGLGPAAGRRAVPLAQARRLNRAIVDQRMAGIDPLAAKTGSRAAARANAIASPTFERCALDFIEAKSSEWSNKVHAAQWEQSLRTYVYPVIGQIPVRDVGVAHVEAVLKPIWNSKRPTASRVRGRIEKILGRAKALGLRDGLNPARWEENLDSLLPALSKVQRVQAHHAAMAYEVLGDFMTELRAIDGPVARALEYTIRCASRTGETLFATWAEIDLVKRQWVVPAERMKMGIEHRVPLDERSLEILREMAETRHGDFIFQVDGEPLGPDAMLRLLQRDMKRPDVTVHGFRASFRTWIDERTSVRRDVAEIALAHGNKDQTESAYARAKFVEQLRQLADIWGAFCSMPSVRPSGDVVDFVGRDRHGG